MIASVSGTVLVRSLDHVVVEAAGVGYHLNVSSTTMGAIPVTGERATLHSHLVVRDDAMHLYGFATSEEREMFMLLTGVSGVGPKVALAVLSSGPVDDLRRALAAADADRFQAVPGIGKRTAERIVVELKDRVLPGDVQTIAITHSSEPRALAREGLLGLGYVGAEVDAMLARAEGDTAEQLIGSALRGVAA